MKIIKATDGELSWYRNKVVDGKVYKYRIENYRDKVTGEPKQHSTYIGKVNGDTNDSGDHKSKSQKPDHKP